MPKEVLQDASFTAAKGGRLDMDALQNFLVQNGYMRTETVREAGEYAMRGGILDLFPPGHEEPVRLDLFGDEVESIRAFDPLSQVTHKDVSQFSLQPVTEFFLNEESIDRFRSGYREEFGVVQGDDPLYESVSEGRRYNGMEHWLPLFYERMDTLLDYAPGCAVTLDHHGRRAHDERFEQIRDFYQSRKTLETAAKGKKSKDVSLSGSLYHPLPEEKLYLGDAEWAGVIEDADLLSPFGEPGKEEQGTKKARDFADIRALPDGDVIGELKTHLTSLGDRKILIAAYSQGSLQRLQAMMEAVAITNITVIQEAAQFNKHKPGEICLTVLTLEHGFTADDLAVLTEQDILGDRLARKSAKRKKADNFLREVSTLDEGDLVTHIDHGIGKFLELETVTVGKIHHDCRYK